MLSGLKMAGTTAEDRAAFSSESDGNSTAKRTAVWGHLQDRLTISGSGLEVQKIPRVNDCLGTDGQTKRGKILSHLDAKRGIVNRETPGKGIDRKHGRFRRKSKYGLHVSAGRPIAGDLQSRALKEAVTKHFRRTRDPVGRKLLPATERIAGRGTPDAIQAMRVNQTETTRRPLLIGDTQQCRSALA